MREKLRLRVPNRRQLQLVSQDLESTVSRDHMVRTVWTVAEHVDLGEILSKIRVTEGTAGRDATDPRLLFALWLYATIRGVGSARELNRLCTESAPYRWLCGGISMNYHTLADFRVKHGKSLDAIFTRVIASLVEKQVVTVKRISQDGTRVRASAGSSSFRRKVGLQEALKEACEQVETLKRRIEDPAKSGGMSQRQNARRLRAAKRREQKVKAALAQIPEMEKRQEKLKESLTAKQKEKLEKQRQPRASTTDSDARKMKMSDGGTRPAMNFQFAVDTESRAIVGVDVINLGVDTNQLAPMREQVEERTGLKVEEHLADGGYLTIQDVKLADSQGVDLFVPPKPRRKPELYGDEFTPKKGESKAESKWRKRMGSKKGKKIYLERASTVETVNADLKTYRGLEQLKVRGLKKARCIGLWAAMAYNVFHFAHHFAGGFA